MAAPIIQPLAFVACLRWPGKTEQAGQWNFCLSAARIPRVRRAHDEADTPEPQPGFQGEGGLAALKGGKPLAGLAQLHDVHPNQITAWKAQLLEGAAGLFGGSLPTVKEAAPAVDVKSLHAKIGELTVKNGFWPVRPARPEC